MILTLIRHRKLTVILVPVGKGEGDDVVARVGDVDLQVIRFFFTQMPTLSPPCPNKSSHPPR